MRKISAFLFLILLSIIDLHAQFTSAGTEFCFSVIQNRIDKNGAPTSCLLSEVKVRFVISNNTQYSADIEIDYSGNNISYLINNTLYTTASADNIHQLTIGPDQSIMVEVIPTTTITYNDPCPGANQTTRPDIRDALLMNNDEIQSKVYWVTSLNNINVTVYAETSQGGGRDASMILPTHSLGYVYYAVSTQPTPLEYPTVTYGGNLGGPSEIGIVSQHNNCEIQFELPPAIISSQTANSNIDANGSNSIYGGIVHTITLNKGEAYQIQSDDFDLTGTKIWSDDMPFAVYSGNMAAKIVNIPGASAYGFDQVYTQLFPVKNWGNQYIVTPIPNNINDLIKVVAIEDSTEIFMNGVSMGIIDNGEQLQIELPSGTTAFIETNIATVLVSQFSKSTHYANGTHQNYDPSLVMIPTINQTIEEITFSVLPEIDYSNPNCNDNVKKDYVSVIAHASEISTIMIDDFLNGPVLLQNYSYIHTPWTQISGNNDYYYSILNISNNSITNAVPYHLFMTGTPVYGFNAMVHGLDCAETYSYAAGINIIVDTTTTLDITFDFTPYNCIGDTITFNLYSNLSVDSVIWNFSDQTSGVNNSSSLISPDHIFQNQGYYEVTVNAYSGSLSDSTTQYLFISEYPDFGFTTDSLFASSFPVELSASTTGCSYQWSNNFISEAIQVNESGTYAVTVTNSNGCAISDSIVVVNETGISLVEADSHKRIFPNPVDKILTIDMGDLFIYSVTVYNSKGNIVINKQVNANTYEINTASLRTGIYYLCCVTNKNNLITDSFYVNRE